MNLLLAIPLAARLALIAVVGSLLAMLVNLGVYRLAWRPRAISPWSAPPSGGTRRTWRDHLPIAGWWSLRRESALHGRGFWIRPMLVELTCGLLLAALYYWDTERMLGPLLLPVGPGPAANFLNANITLVLHAQFVAQATLMLLMLTASLIDIDEKTIPDAITIPGALIGLIFAAVYPWSLLTCTYWVVGGMPQIEFLTMVSPDVWPVGLVGWPPAEALAVALACWSLWCFGLLPRRWTVRRGWKTAVRVFVHRLWVERVTWWIALLWLGGLGAITAAARLLPDPHWAGLLTSLVGMTAGSGAIWLVRIIGTAALGREAMGFGDVTLMAMVGAFVGWQASIVIFFLAPFLGLLIGLANVIFRGDHEIPYGPFLCAATAVVVVQWDAVWNRSIDIFALGWVLPAVLLFCLLLMGVVLAIYRVARDLLLPTT